MEKSCHSSRDCTSDDHPHQNNNNSNNSRGDQYLKQLNKISHKISKDSRPPPPPIRKYPPLDHHLPNHNQHQQHQQHQPPVYNINKNDFRDVVQKLTGSPAHERTTFSTPHPPPPIQPPKPPSSRLHRIRPPPLAHLTPPPPPLNTTTTLPHSLVSPLSPLPPFPAVHASAESPISAYMRYLKTSSISTVDSESKRFSSSGLFPRWINPNSLQPPPPSLPQTQQILLPSSPLSFGKLSSPLSPYPLLSPTFLFSPTAGQLGFPQFPPSPRFPVPSPRWRDL